MKLIKHLLDKNGQGIVSLGPDATVLEALTLMADKTIGSLVIMEGDELLGIVTERDYARKVIIKGRASRTTLVSEIMTTGVFTASSMESVNDCMALMTKKRIRHLPVVEDNRIIGMISIRDLVDAIMSDQQEEIEQLGQYISG
ncbi:MAG: CBS domain-containing protein [Desulfobulbaceae bacterium]|nr:CBS domain-containing protein [Desulfobulbaceae bacterium]